jgi:hypothetical protein
MRQMVAWRVGCGSSEAAQCPPDKRSSDEAGQEPVGEVGQPVPYGEEGSVVDVEAGE